MDRLPFAIFDSLSDCVRLGASLVALDQSQDSVTVHFRTRAGRSFVIGDYAIVTLPFSVLRRAEVLKPFGKAKQRAIRDLHYEASTRIFVQSRTRFWEEEGIYGGASATDLAIRQVLYPEHDRETGRGVLLASSTWGDDARRWGSLSPEDRIRDAVDDLARLHPRIREEFEAGASVAWHQDEFSRGAAAMFEPGQRSRLLSEMAAPEGRIHFAGDHTSVLHRWVNGAIESGLRAAHEVHASAASGPALFVSAADLGHREGA